MVSSREIVGWYSLRKISSSLLVYTFISNKLIFIMCNHQKSWRLKCVQNDLAVCKFFSTKANSYFDHLSWYLWIHCPSELLEKAHGWPIKSVTAIQLGSWVYKCCNTYLSMIPELSQLDTHWIVHTSHMDTTALFCNLWPLPACRPTQFYIKDHCLKKGN